MPEATAQGDEAPFDRLTAASRAVGSDASLAELLEIVVGTAESLLAIQTVVLLQEDGSDLVSLRAGRGFPDGSATKLEASLNEALFERLAALLGTEPSHGLVGMPLVARGRVRGSLVALLPGARELTPREEWVLCALADQASAALEHEVQETTRQDLASRVAELRARGRRQEQAMQVVRHDLATPIGAIRGYVELLERNAYGPLSPRQRTALHRIDVAVSHLEGLVEEALELSRLNSGEVRVAHEPVPVRPVVEEALGMVELAARDGRVRIRAEVPADLSVRGDERCVRQVVVHLLDNAIKHGGKDREVSVTAARDDEGATATIRVRDQGPGVPSDVADQVFEPYKTFGGRAGSGLGLAIARAVTELMGGEVGVESNGSSGATFFVRLPLA